MSSIGTSKGVLEIVKFAVYVSVPIGLIYLLDSNVRQCACAKCGSVFLDFLCDVDLHNDHILYLKEFIAWLVL